MPAKTILLSALATLALAAPIAAAAPATAPPALVKAERLASIWGRCTTAAPANALLRVARRPAADQVRARRAGAALRAFRAVAAECGKPVPMPTVVVPPSEGPVLPPAESPAPHE